MTIELGGNIRLTGFSDKEFPEMVVVKKMVGQYARKLHDSFPGFEELKITRKDVHGSQNEVHTQVVIEGSHYEASVTDQNLFVAIDESLKKMLEQAEKK